MQLKETREKAGITPQGAMARVAGIDVPMYNKIERGKCLPTVPQLRRICAALNCRPLDIYTRAEIDLINCQESAQKSRPGDRHILTHKKTFRLSPDVAKAIPGDFLSWKNCRSWQEWSQKHLDADLAAYHREKERSA